MLVKELWEARKRHVLTIISLVVSLVLVFMVEVVSTSLSSQINQEISSLNCDISSIQLFTYPNETWLKEVSDSYLVRVVQSKYSEINICRTTNRLEELFDLKVESGRFLNEKDILFNDNNVVIGFNCQNYFNNPSVGEYIYLDGIPFKVVGILKEKGDSLMLDIDNSIYIPIDYKLYSGSESYFYIETKVDIDKYFSKDDYLVLSQEGFQDSFMLIVNLIAMVMKFIANGSLVVAFVGITDNSLAQLSKREKEIGIKKALGASDLVIIFEYLIELLVMIIIAIFISVIICYGLLIVIDKLLGLSITIGYLKLIRRALLIVAITLLAGLLPALKARKITIIESLKAD